MRVLLRVLTPLIALAFAAVGVLLVIEVVAAWVRPTATAGLVVPWHDWRTLLEQLTWASNPVPWIAIGVAVAGLLLVLIGLSARRADIHFDARHVGSAGAMTVTTSPRVLARIIGRRVRSAEDVAAASVTASARKVTVSAQGWGDAGPELRTSVTERVDALLEQLPLRRSPRVTVTVQERKGPA
ncbi:DUF6286 domain-containing protein [Pseudonocardia sp. GCM10023141]|uniref:DUF6286 domain-containing protein n=1 Tax=Pseudonocardia sp. GCM10023141 TaxID=3252653 RepID=UPI00360BCDBD